MKGIKPGVLTRIMSLSGPASSRQTRRLPSSDNRPATALPALPLLAAVASHASACFALTAVPRGCLLVLDEVRLGLLAANALCAGVLPLLLVLLEIPAIILGILLARGVQAGTPWGEIAREVLLGKSVLLLLGGLLIGWAAGPVGLEPLAPLFFDLFKGILAIFLLEMGLIAADHLGGFRRHGLFMGTFALLIPPCFAMIGIGFAQLMDLSLGGTILLATLAASASYIAAPAAMRSAVPEANPALSLTAALAITFPFNILIGIPLYQRIATWLMEMPS